MTAFNGPGADAGSDHADLPAHADEPHAGGVGETLNWLRAGVLGADDGIVSTAGILVGVAAATIDRGAIFTAGIAALAAGAVSMALGEYVSVSTQRDTERALIRKERAELRDMPEEEFDELVGLYRDRGLSESTARQVATELTEHDALAAHAEVELGIDPDTLTNPWHAAGSSAASFTLGAALPLIAILVLPQHIRIPVTFVVVCLALALTGWISARIGQADARLAILRVTMGGALAMTITYLIGLATGHVVG